MPRDSNGIYTLPVAPFVPGTVIKSSEVNSDFSDIAQALTESMNTDGTAPMTGPLLLADGSSAQPSLTMEADQTTGWFRSGAGQWTFVSSGIDALVMDASNILYIGNLSIAGDFALTGNIAITGDISAGSVTTLNIGISDLAATPATPSTGINRIYGFRQALNPNNSQGMWVINDNGYVSPLYFQGGQCRLELLTTGPNAGKLVLNPYMGNALSITGQPRQIPDGSGFGLSQVVLSASNTAATFVYIYAYMSTQFQMSLEMSTVAPSDNPLSGVKIKSTDATRTLVGAAYTDTGGAWADTAGKLWVISYFNRRRKQSRVAVTTGANVVVATCTVQTEMSVTFRNNFITWNEEMVRGVFQLTGFASVAGGTWQIGNRVDNTPAIAYNNWQMATAVATPINLFTNYMDIPTSTLTEAAVHFTSPTLVASAANLNIQVSVTAGASAMAVMFNIVEIMG